MLDQKLKAYTFSKPRVTRDHGWYSTMTMDIIGPRGGKITRSWDFYEPRDNANAERNLRAHLVAIAKTKLRAR